MVAYFSSKAKVTPFILRQPGVVALTKNRIDLIKKCMEEYTNRNLALMDECTHKVAYPSRTEIVRERVIWCHENISGKWGHFNLGNDHLWCFQEVKDAVYFKTYWGALTWEDLYDRK